MSTKLLDTFVRISKGTRTRLNAHCKKYNLQQGRFADDAIVFLIENWTPSMSRKPVPAVIAKIADRSKVIPRTLNSRKKRAS